MKRKELAGARVSRANKPREHLNRQIPPEAHTAMYVWHKYWSRKTWNVVGEFIRAYSRENDVVFDPFSGSGVVAIEAARHKRRAIVCDLNPIASLITDLTIRPVKLLALQEAFDRVRVSVQKKIETLYRVACVECGQPVVAACFVRTGDEVTEVRYPACPACGFRCEQGRAPNAGDIDALKSMEKRRIREWHPKNRLFYDDGEPFKEKQKFDSLDRMFTPRNLQAAAWLHEAIRAEKSPHLRRFLMGGFTSMIHLCTRMMPVGNPQPSNHYTYFSSPGWTQHSYWAAPRHMEQNVWTRFEGAIAGHQGLLRAKEESMRVLPAVRITKDWREVLAGEADIAIVTGDSLNLMDAMPEECMDYVFTDPPYDASVQYGELSYLWNAWIREDFRYAERIATHEVVRNERQRKPFDVYHSLLSNSFRGFHKVLRRDGYLTVTFHNPEFKVRNATVRAGVFAGFDYEKIHHQPLGQVSAKAMLQPFGSAQGDFYLRFHKGEAGAARTMEEVTDERFRRIVIETCREVIAERAEPTPYTILLNFVDPVLARMGLFGTLATGLDVKRVLEESVGKDFDLVPARIGSAEGKLWWFKDPVFVARLAETPLSERVEDAVLRCVSERGRVTFTQVWDAVSQQFPNSLTSDSTSIREALDVYARQVGKGYWMLREEIRQHVSQHAEIIALLAAIGRHEGHDIWIARNEQSQRAGGLAPSELLSAAVTVKLPSRLDGVTNLRPVLDMDLLWIDGSRVIRAFEVEATTTMTSGLFRGSNLPASVPKTMVLPEERARDFDRKMQSPLFREHYAKDGWNRLFFTSLRRAYAKSKVAADLGHLYDEPISPAAVLKARESGQGFLALE